jgi:hypothetical protein
MRNFKKIKKYKRKIKKKRRDTIKQLKTIKKNDTWDLTFCLVTRRQLILNECSS